MRATSSGGTLDQIVLTGLLDVPAGTSVTVTGGLALDAVWPWAGGGLMAVGAAILRGVAAATAEQARNTRAMMGFIARCSGVVPPGTTSLTLAEAQFYLGRQIEHEIDEVRRSPPCLAVSTTFFSVSTRTNTGRLTALAGPRTQPVTSQVSVLVIAHRLLTGPFPSATACPLASNPGNAIAITCPSLFISVTFVCH